MQGYVLLKRSQMAYDARDALRVFTLAQAALEGPWQLPRRIRAEMTLQVALRMAICGEPLPAVERTLDDARELLAGRPGTMSGRACPVATSPRPRWSCAAPSPSPRRASRPDRG